MSAEDNKAAVRRFYEEVFNRRNLAVVDELITPDATEHTFGIQGVAAAKQFFGMLFQAFPDLHVEVHDMVAEGDRVAVRSSFSGTHQGEFMGIPATGVHATTSAVEFYRMQDGRQAEHWGGPDMASLLQQLGVIPGPGGPG
jgi:steroid delta-isomerase-like uncharacterized protein